jgi:hypothetical protein
LAGARDAEVSAIMRKEEANLDRLILLATSLPADDRRKLASFLLKDMQDGYAKRERNREAKQAR